MTMMDKFLEIIDYKNKAKKSKNKLWYIWKARHRKFEIMKKLEGKETLTINDIMNCISIINCYKVSYDDNFISEELGITNIWIRKNKAYYGKYIRLDDESFSTFYIYINDECITIDAGYNRNGNFGGISTHNTVEVLDVESYISMALIEDVRAIISKIIERAFKND